MIDLKWRRKRGRIDSSAEILLKLKIQKIIWLDLINGGMKEKLFQDL